MWTFWSQRPMKSPPAVMSTSRQTPYVKFNRSQGNYKCVWTESVIWKIFHILHPICRRMSVCLHQFLSINTYVTLYCCEYCSCLNWDKHKTWKLFKVSQFIEQLLHRVPEYCRGTFTQNDGIIISFISDVAVSRLLEIKLKTCRFKRRISSFSLSSHNVTAIDEINLIKKEFQIILNI